MHCSRRFRELERTAIVGTLVGLLIPSVAQAQLFDDLGDWAAAAGAHLTIDFEDFADGTIITDQYNTLSPGVVFSSGGPGFVEIEDSAGIAMEVGGFPVSGEKVLDVEASNTDSIVARFFVSGTSTPTTVPAVGAWMIDLSTFAGGTAEFFDINGILLDTLTVTPGAMDNQFFGAVIPAGIHEVRFDGVANGEFVLIDDFVFAEGAPAADRTLIIKQGVCPAPVNPASRGLTPMLLVGDEDFDVSQIDLSSLELTRCDGVGDAVAPHSGPPGPGARIVDLNHPNVDEVGCGDGQVPCACNADQSSDGIDDLELKFDTSDMTEAFMLDGEPTGVPITLFLTGELADGSQFVAADCIRTVGPPVPPGMLLVGATVPNVWVGVTPLDLIFDGGGFASFERSYPLGSVVELSAPTTYNGWVFLGWDLNDLPVDDLGSTAFIAVTDETTTAFARYLLIGDLNDDGVVGVPELLALLGAWGPCPSCSNCPADVDGDCQVGVPDLLILLANWG